MAIRPAWSIINGKVKSKEFEFAWSGGFAISQKQKNIKALHQAIRDVTEENALEISSKSTDLIGTQLSAFSMKLNGLYLENIFQSSKRYENGGPYMDLLNVEPKEAKRDERHRTSGRLLSFVKEGEEWPLEPKTTFYDYIYVSAVIENFGYNLDLSGYTWFTDIEFNPKKSINCQARAITIYKLMQNMNLWDVISSRDTWIDIHKKYVED